jgi:hypothetical protein
VLNLLSSAEKNCKYVLNHICIHKVDRTTDNGKSDDCGWLAKQQTWSRNTAWKIRYPMITELLIIHNLATSTTFTSNIRWSHCRKKLLRKIFITNNQCLTPSRGKIHLLKSLDHRIVFIILNGCSARPITSWNSRWVTLCFQTLSSC